MTRKSTLSGIYFVLLLVIGTAQGEAEELTRKKLQVFILAGQSNMVGHANYITIPTLFTAKEPAVLQQMMRHESIETTMRFYVGRNAQTTAAAMWEAHKSADARRGYDFGYDLETRATESR